MVIGPTGDEVSQPSHNPDQQVSFPKGTKYQQSRSQDNQGGGFHGYEPWDWQVCKGVPDE
jgi:hypothetical protein